ncbi:MAG TPA: S41 family peptidase [Anaerolineaceae bacterium]|nr:S41 family peptidase [Anaerolineaceae bacterium]HQH57450.1 S41 family peptidase [Anaerolineaceae bacterium]HQK03366.1 S41 family peptidase [Anaerolineaceae bacterium]
MQQGKVLRTILLTLLVLVLISGAFMGGLIAGNALPVRLLPSGQGTQAANTEVPAQQTTAEGAAVCTDYTSSSTPEELKQTFAPFWETWSLLHESFVDQPLDDVALMRGAISGMLAATGDKHTTYMDPTEFEQANASMEGEYEGIGAWVDTTGEYVQIISPMKGSPAEAAGLRANDIVIAVDGEDQTGVPGDLVLKKILGPAGEAVTLTIRRGEETLEFTIIRAKITVPVVDYRMLDNNIAYLALYSFNDQATSQLRAALKELMAQKPAGLIFDLRDNGGGYLSTAIDVVSEFIPSGVVMYEEYGDGTRDAYTAKRGGRATEIPLVVLVNEGTASASEITAGAIQDLGRGKLVGVRTYGKGSVQNWIPLTTEKGGVRITIARWLTPKGTQISDIGLTPDLIVEMTEEDYAQGRDPQLDAAVQLLLQP